jgi:Fe-S-cluster containining protein
MRTAAESIHAEVDARVAPLLADYGDRLTCRRGCSACCTDDLTVFEVEAEAIRQHHGELLAEGVPAPVGRCAFLDAEGACRIYEHRPYVCRTQGLPLRWFEEDEATEEVAEYRDICELNVDTVDPIDLTEDQCWLIGPVEESLARLQGERDGGAYRRVALRSLFARSGAAG